MAGSGNEQEGKIRIIFVDDHEIFHECIRHLFDQQQHMQMLAVANNGRAAVRLARELVPDVVVMDISMPGLNGIDATRRILADNPKIKVIALSMHSDRTIIQQILQAGARGYVLKDCAFDELLMAIQAVMHQNMYLSPKITSVVLDDYLQREQAPAVSGTLTVREREVLQLIAEGKSTRQIADELNVSVKTVETHRGQVMKKLNLHSLADLVKYAVREGLTTLSF
ncbi:MAG: response regulator transcription factor [Desulfuromonadales bacterium]|nr:response regulator transcription factor [Desulfuromonadales bacterium]